MSLHHLGKTRSRRALDHLLQTPDTFVYATLPGMVDATAVVHAGPAIGAGFVQYTAVLQTGGQMGSTTLQRFVYVLQGEAQVLHGDACEVLRVSGYAYLPVGEAHTITAVGETRLAVIEKAYVGVDGGAPYPVFGDEANVPPVALMGDDGIGVRALLPAEQGFDFAVNTMEYRPGARLGMVEVHVMEHGLLMLEGEGVYRLGDHWYPVAAGDFIWMGPFCPQWFGALGETAARYLIYKDWNRHPMAQTTRGGA